MAIWARAYEKVRKLALLYACSENHENPQIITVAGIDWVWAMVEHQTRRMLYMADLYVADSEFDADCKKVIEVLTKWRERHGGEFMAHWRVGRAVCWTENKIEEVRESLVAQDLIEVQMPPCGRMRPHGGYACISFATADNEIFSFPQLRKGRSILYSNTFNAIYAHKETVPCLYDSLSKTGCRSAIRRPFPWWPAASASTGTVSPNSPNTG